MAGSAFGKPFGSVRQATPAFQREWVTLQSSSVDITDVTIGNTRDLTPSPSSLTTVNGTDTLTTGTIYIWGFVLATASHNMVAGGYLVDEDDKKYLGALATQNGPFFIAYDTPVKVTKNSKIIWKSASNVTLVSAATLFYTILPEEPPTEVS